MLFRFKRGRTALASCATLPFGALLLGCLGAGDDNTSPPLLADAGDSSVADVASADAARGDAAGEGSTKSTDAPSSPDADGTVASDAGGPPGSGDATLSAPVAIFSSASLDFGQLGCGGAPATQGLTISNRGQSPLVVSASVAGSAFALAPTSLMVPPNGSGTLNVTATVSSSATAGTPVTGSLAVFTNDPSRSSETVLVTAMPTGATLTGSAQYVFASTEVGVPAAPVALLLKNTGNASTTVTLGAPSNPSVTLSGLPDAGGVLLPIGASLMASATFTPATSSQALSATTSITTTGTICGSSLTSLTFAGQGSEGSLVGWPSNGAVDFGVVACGAPAPAAQHVVLSNTSATTDARITSVDTSKIGLFATDATKGERITAGGTLTLSFTAPAGPQSAPTLAPITGTVVIHTDADATPSGTSLALSEQPQGAVLAFGDSATPGCTTSPNLGAFGSTGLLLQPVPPQSFCVVNKGNMPAHVTLVAAENGSMDGGAGGNGAGGGSDGGDGAAGTRPPATFSTLPPDFDIPAAAPSGPSVQQESLTFEPLHANATVGSLTMGTSASAVLCAPLPAPLPLSGSAVGGGPVVTPPVLTFQATCGGSAPASQTFVVSNSGSAVLSWTLSSPVGPGAAQYTVTANPPPGTLLPNSSSTVTVSAAAVPSPAPNPSPAALAAQVTVTTDVPFDPPHVVQLSEVPLGDQLFLAVPDPVSTVLRFGEVPTNTSVSRTFTLANAANPGSASASVSWSITGAGAGAYSQPQQTAGSLAAGASATETIAFDAPAAMSYPATLSVTTSDALCAPLPAPIPLSGTGTAGLPELSASILYFGNNPNDPNAENRGLVNCGTAGTPQTLTISNIGTQAFKITGLTLSKGSASPFTLSGPASSLPTLAIGASATLTIAPSLIPQSGVDPNDVSRFADNLTVTTDAGGDSPHYVVLVMQPRGVVLSGPIPPSVWTFGQVAVGSIGTFQAVALQNSGNIPAIVTLQPAQPLSLPSVFTLQGNPLTVAAGSVSELVGQFTPTVGNSSWSGQGTLAVTADAFCSPLPASWMAPVITMSGTSSSNPLVVLSGSLVFPTTDCGGAPPGGQSVTLTNQTNQAYSYTVKLQSGVFYTFADGGSGQLAANGTATIVVNPKAVTPGMGVLPGSAPYADDLLISVASSPSTSFTVPVSWTLSGAVLSLVYGAGPFGPAGSNFYAADSTSGFALGLNNSGTAAAQVDFAIQPSGAFSVSPAPPVHVLPGIPALPELVSSASAPACTMPASATATFVYSGPVCQPLPMSSVNVHYCSGTYTP